MDKHKITFAEVCLLDPAVADLATIVRLMSRDNFMRHFRTVYNLMTELVGDTRRPGWSGDQDALKTGDAYDAVVSHLCRIHGFDYTFGGMRATEHKLQDAILVKES